VEKKILKNGKTGGLNIIFEYPKIQTLFNRNPKTFKVIEDEIRRPEFLIPSVWDVTEKIHGTNTRIYYNKYESTNPYITIHGRTDKAELPKHLIEFLKMKFTVEQMQTAFTPDKFPIHGCYSFKVCLYGESFGYKINSGNLYTPEDTVAFQLFDVFIEDSTNPLGGWWLELDNIADIAKKLDIKCVPYLGPMYTDDIIDMVKDDDVMQSNVEGSHSGQMSEGVVCRSKPLLFTRDGKRLMWKVKRKDFERI